MKIEKLTIHNIASIADAVIDFTAAPLADSSVFLIAGDTGAGKSTILDCICVALYGNTPRYASCRMKGRQLDSDNSEISINEPRQLLRRNTGEGFVNLHFTGNDNVKYEARWSVRRSRNKPGGKLQQKERALIERDSERVVATKDQDIRQHIEAAVGLDFDQFCRTCMLAQGEFDRFLNSNDDEKAAILEKIIGNPIYTRIGRKLYEVTADRRREYEQLKAKCEGFVIPTEEELQKLASETAEAAAKAAAEGAEVKRFDTAIAWFDAGDKLAKESAEAEAAHKKALEDAADPHFKEMQQRAKDYTEAEPLRNLLAALTTARRDLDARNKELNLLKSSFIRCLGYSLYLKRSIREIDDKESKDFDSEILTENYSSLRQRISSLLPELECPAFAPEGDTYRYEYGYISELDALLTAIDALRYHALLADTTTKLGIIDSFRNAVAELNKARAKRAEDADELAELNKAVAALEKEKEESRKELERAEKDLAKANERHDAHCHTIDDWARNMRLILKPGDDCPVCGRKIEQALPSEEHFAALMEPYKKDVEDAQKEHTRASEKVNSAAMKYSAEAKLLSRLQKKYDADKSVENASQRIDALLTEHPDVLSRDLEPKVLEEMSTSLRDKQKEYNDKVRATNTVRGLIAEAKEEFKKRETRHNDRHDSRTRHSEALGALETATASILRTMPEWQPAEDDRIREVTAAPDHTAILTNVASAKSMIAAITETIADTEGKIAEERKRHAGWDDEYISRLAAMTPADAEKINRNINTVKEAVTRSEQNLANVASRISDHQKQRPEMGEDASAESCREQRAIHAKTLEEANILHGACLERAKRYEDDSRRFETISRQMKSAGEEYDRWNALCSELGSADGKVFRRIALSYVLENLVLSANEYMRRLFPRYSLSVQPGTYVLNVRDRFMDSTSRAVSGISGGETFIVSLALALALAEIGGAMTVNILFIDEGFGSLSGEPLNNAIETLRQLSSKAGRRVGIISHVEELRDRIPVQIRVKASAAKSVSTISVYPEDTPSGEC